MNYIEKNVEFFSSNKINKINAKVYIPEDKKNIKGIVQISYGMCEYIARYKEFMEYLVYNNFIACCSNHLGHGENIAKDDRGFFASENGYRYLVEDLYILTKIVKNKYKNIPYFLLGHSMGSFIARCYMYKYGNIIDGYIIMGTGGKNKLIDTGIKLTNLVISKKGEKYRSRFLTNLVIGKFNEKFKPNLSKYDWLTSDKNMYPKYQKDTTSDFIFTASGYKDLFYLIKNCNDIKNIKKVPNYTNIFILSGDMDPVGTSGDSVLQVYHDYIKTGHENVTLKLYPNLRHELLNETKKYHVYEDILSWIKEIIEKMNKKDKDYNFITNIKNKLSIY